MIQEIIHRKILPGKIVKIVKGDITEERVDAIVNAANSNLEHGGGVAGAIVRKGGKVIQEESDRIGFVPVGQAVLTGAGHLSAKFVIHTVGPRWGEGEENLKLKNAVESSLKLAEKENMHSISLPAISAGIFGFPKEECAEIILKTLFKYIKNHEDGSLREIRICLFDEFMIDTFLSKFQKM
jgi:O-acetyl-ADP-ribose deacetylase (regulator of RNase III)